MKMESQRMFGEESGKMRNKVILRQIRDKRQNYDEKERENKKTVAGIIMQRGDKNNKGQKLQKEK